MKKNNLTLIIFLFLGLVAGLIFTMLFANVEALSLLTKSVEFKWQPQADITVITYDIDFKINLNLLSLLGVLGAYILYRKL